MEQNNDKLMKILEEEFLRKLESGESIREYLHIPYSFLTSRVKKELDNFLMEESFSIISSPDFSVSDFKVYSDEKMEIRLDDPEQQAAHIERLMEKFQETEEYEKCALLTNIMQQIQHR